MEQMVSGSNIFSLGGPESAYMKGRTSEKGEGGKILRVLAQINSLTFCPVCWPTGRNKRMKQERKTDSLSVAESSRSESPESVITDMLLLHFTWLLFGVGVGVRGGGVNKQQYLSIHPSFCYFCFIDSPLFAENILPLASGLVHICLNIECSDLYSTCSYLAAKWHVMHCD